MEAMRRRAEQISLSSPGERLPLPAARDEIRRLDVVYQGAVERWQARAGAPVDAAGPGSESSEEARHG